MNTLPPLSRQRVQQAIAALRDEVGVTNDTTASPIVPLGEIMASTSLTCAEIPGLTMRTALLHLAQQRTLPELPQSDDEHTPLAGFLFATERYGTIFVCQEDPIVRRRFTVAHELGHYFLHIRPVLPHLQAQGRAEIYESLPLQRASGGDEESQEEAVPADPPTGELRVVGSAGELPWSTALVEREADAFAAELLMPAMMVRLLFTRYRAMVSRDDLVWRLASEMLVSGAAMRRRLADLALPLEEK